MDTKTRIVSFFFLFAVAVLGIKNGKGLVVIDNSGAENEFSNLLSVLKDSVKSIETIQGDKLTKSISISIGEEEPLYDSIYFLKSTWGRDDWTAQQVTNYVKSGGNFFMVGAEKIDVLNEFGLEGVIGEDIFIDEVKKSSQSSKPSSINLQWNSQHAFSSFPSSDTSISISKLGAAYKLRNDPKLESFNPLIQSALSFAPGSGICPIKAAGSCVSGTFGVSLLATLESRGGSRFMAGASSKLFANNGGFSKEQLEGLMGWLHGTRFALKIASFSHSLMGHHSNRGKTELDSTIYRVQDRIRVRMCLSEPLPSSVNPSDFQFELKMMNIQLRKSFSSELDSDSCLVSEDIQLPSKPAVYTLQVFYNRPGWSQLQHSEKILLRPFRHNEFPRFLRVALPYYVSWLGLFAASLFILLPRLFKSIERKGQ